MTKAVEIIAGTRYGEMVTTGRSFIDPEARRPVWECLCDCGVYKAYVSTLLTKGKVKSCGGHPTKVSREAARKLLQSKAVYPKGFGAGTKLYRAWRAMKSRCTVSTDAAYPGYGGAGVTLHTDWYAFGPFMEWSRAHGFGEGLTIDRVDPFGGYGPDNCRWVTMLVQGRNKRKPCHLLTAFGETKLEVEWVKDERCAVKQSTLRERVRAGWVPELALTKQARLLSTKGLQHA